MTIMCFFVPSTKGACSTRCRHYIHENLLFPENLNLLLYEHTFSICDGYDCTKPNIYSGIISIYHTY